MKDSNFELIFGLGGFVVGLIGIGYAYGSRKRLNGICDKLGSAIDDVSKTIISRKIEDEIDAKVRAEINVRSSTIRQEVKNKISDEVAKISADEIADEIREDAKEKVAAKFDNELDDILSEFNNNLEHVSKIYSSIADKMAGIGNNKDFKISLG